MKEINMSTLLTQQFLTNLLNTSALQPKGCLDYLISQGIKVKHYDTGITLLDYHLTDSQKTNPIVQECRSLILDTNTFELVSRKFNRFFNHGEYPEYFNDFDWPNAICLEKADGSLIGVYKHNDKWEISTRGMAYAEGKFQDTEFTFRDLVIKCFGFESEDKFQSCFDSISNGDHTFIFEFTSPDNRIVTPYKEDKMILIGITHKKLDLLFNYECLFDVAKLFAQKCNVRVIGSIGKGLTVEQVIEKANQLPNLEEGFVVWCQKTDKRCKIKSSAYVVAHSIKGNDPLPTRKNLLNLFFTGQLDEFIAYFPEWKEKADSIVAEVTQAMLETFESYEKYSKIESQKDFAIAISNCSCKSVLFQARKEDKTIEQVWNDLPAETKIRMFDK